MVYDEIKDPIRRLIRIMERLQEPGGCPWDLEQTHASLKPYMIEEAYEAIDAIDRDDLEHLGEELGDVLLQVVFHSVLAARSHGVFRIDDVANAAAAKMIRRHPHVFGDFEAKTANDVLQNWDQLKARERQQKAEERKARGEEAGGAMPGMDNTPGREADRPAVPDSILSGIPATLPALLKSQRMQEKAARVGFDWPDPLQVLDKVEEEVGELRAAIASGDKPHAKEELGDLIFSLVNLARFLDVDAEDSTRLAADKFRNRFHYIEEQAILQGRSLAEMSLDEMEAHWTAAKQEPRT